MIQPPYANIALWIGIGFCIAQTGIFSGLNLAIFSVSRLRLEVEAAGGNGDAAKLLRLRADSNFTLATILWGNVATNVLLTLLSESVLAGVGAFVFSTVAITFLGEIIPQAYFSRNALRIAARFAPFLKFYQVMLFAVAKPTALFLNLWLGPESIALLRERDFHTLLLKHVEAGSTDLGRLEATGALNFLDLDDIVALDEGEPVDPRSIIRLPIKSGWPVLPAFERTPSDVFLRQLDASGRKWVIFVDESGAPRMVLHGITCRSWRASPARSATARHSRIGCCRRRWSVLGASSPGPTTATGRWSRSSPRCSPTVCRRSRRLAPRRWPRAFIRPTLF